VEPIGGGKKSEETEFSPIWRGIPARLLDTCHCAARRGEAVEENQSERRLTRVRKGGDSSEKVPSL